MRHWGDGHGVGGLPGVFRRGADRSPAFIEAVSHTVDELHELVQPVIKRLMKLLTRQGVLAEDMGRTFRAERDANIDRFPLHPSALVGEGNRGY